MRTCEHCGSDAVNAEGLCAICGWQNPRPALSGGESSPSLGATRAASANDYAPRVSAPRQTAGGSVRYCGACGARLSADEVFCGQCGTPVGSSSSGHGTLQGRSPDRQESYDNGLSETWMPGRHNELTEAFSPAARSPYGSGGQVPYRAPQYDRSQPGATAAQDDGSLRSARIIAGIVCLGVSLVSAVLAILLAH